jgi:tetratricopeptide (TPR) repeat protein
MYFRFAIFLYDVTIAIMIDVLIEINGIDQLKIIEPEMIEELTGYLDQLFERSMLDRSLRFGSLLVYRFSPGKREVGLLFDVIMHAWSAIGERSEKLRGYNLIVERDDGIDPEMLREWLEKRILSVRSDRSFWIGKEAAEAFSPYAELLPEGEGFIVKGPGSFDGGQQATISVFMDGHPEMEELMERFGPILNGQEHGILFLHGPAFSGKEHALDYLKRKTAFRRDDLPFLSILPPVSYTGAGVPLIEAAARRGWEHTPDFLSRGAGACWRDLSHLLERDPETVTREDAEMIFGFYLEAYIRQMEEKLLPPLLFIERIGEYRHETVRALGRFLDEHLHSGRLNAILTSREESLPVDFADLPITRVSFDLWKTEELSRLVDRSLLEHLDEGNREASVSLYHTALILERGSGYFSGNTATRKVIRELPFLHRKLLFLATITGGLYTADRIRILFGIDSVERGEFATLASDLIDYGLLAESPLLKPVFPQLRAFLKRELGEEGDALEAFFLGHLEAEQKGLEKGAYRREALLQQEDAASGQTVRWLLERIENLLDMGLLSLAAPFFEQISRKINRMGQDKQELRDHLDALYLLAAIREGRDGLAGEIAARFGERPEPSDWKIRSIRRQALGEYLLAVHAFRKALDPSKAALIELQERKQPSGEAMANLLLGRIILAMGRIDEARDYFLIASETGFQGGEGDHSGEISAYLAAAYYLGGSMSAALREIERASSRLASSGRRQWELFAAFLTGRIFFTLGRYGEAEEQFLFCRNITLLYPSDGSGELVDGWVCRSMIYQGKIDAAVKRLEVSADNPEHRFFQAEAYFLSEEYEKALTAIDRALRLEKERIKLFSRPVPYCWESGFACIEDLAFALPGSHGSLFQLIRAWRGLILSRNGRSEEGQEELARITREEKLAENDPFSHLYLFFQTLAIPETSAGSPEGLDRLTQLSKALRYVQGISSRIEVPADRQDFLNRSYWNAKLTARGRAAKLI